MGDFVALLNNLDLSPVNTLLLVVLFYLIKVIFDRFKQLEQRENEREARHEERNHRQDLALVRLEERLGLQGEKED